MSSNPNSPSLQANKNQRSLQETDSRWYLPLKKKPPMSPLFPRFVKRPQSSCVGSMKKEGEGEGGERKAVFFTPIIVFFFFFSKKKSQKK